MKFAVISLAITTAAVTYFVGIASPAVFAQDTTSTQTQTEAELQYQRQLQAAFGGEATASARTGAVGVNVNNTNNNTVNNTVKVEETKTTEEVKTTVVEQKAPVQELPKTGLPVVAWGLAGLFPIGLKLRKFGSATKEASNGALNLWLQRQDKRA